MSIINWHTQTYTQLSCQFIRKFVDFFFKKCIALEHKNLHIFLTGGLTTSFCRITFVWWESFGLVLYKFYWLVIAVFILNGKHTKSVVRWQFVQWFLKSSPLHSYNTIIGWLVTESWRFECFVLFLVLVNDRGNTVLFTSRDVNCIYWTLFGNKKNSKQIKIMNR